jgi:hypothetical protein
MIPKDEIVPYLQRLVAELHEVPITIVEPQTSDVPKIKRPIRVCDAAATLERRERALKQWAEVRANGKKHL